MDWRHAEELLTAGRGVYRELKNLCVWVKDNGGMGSLYRSQHELVFVFKHGCNGHRNNVQLGRFGRNRSNVWRYPGANSFARCGGEGNLSALHPTVKPVAMVADAILDCSARGDIILDGFVGSGTMVIAAERPTVHQGDDFLLNLRIVQQTQERLFERLVLLCVLDLIFSFGSIFRRASMP